MLDVLVSFIESVRHGWATCA